MKIDPNQHLTLRVFVRISAVGGTGRAISSNGDAPHGHGLSLPLPQWSHSRAIRNIRSSGPITNTCMDLHISLKLLSHNCSPLLQFKVNHAFRVRLLTGLTVRRIFRPLQPSYAELTNNPRIPALTVTDYCLLDANGTHPPREHSRRSILEPIVWDPGGMLRLYVYFFMPCFRDNANTPLGSSTELVPNLSSSARW